MASCAHDLWVALVLPCQSNGYASLEVLGTVWWCIVDWSDQQLMSKHVTMVPRTGSDVHSQSLPGCYDSGAEASAPFLVYYFDHAFALLSLTWMPRKMLVSQVELFLREAA